MQLGPHVNQPGAILRVGPHAIPDQIVQPGRVAAPASRLTASKCVLGLRRKLAQGHDDQADLVQIRAPIPRLIRDDVVRVLGSVSSDGRLELPGAKVMRGAEVGEEHVEPVAVIGAPFEENVAGVKIPVDDPPVAPIGFSSRNLAAVVHVRHSFDQGPQNAQDEDFREMSLLLDVLEQEVAKAAEVAVLKHDPSLWWLLIGPTLVRDHFDCKFAVFKPGQGKSLCIPDVGYIALEKLLLDDLATGAYFFAHYDGFVETSDGVFKISLLLDAYVFPLD